MTFGPVSSWCVSFETTIFCRYTKTLGKCKGKTVKSKNFLQEYNAITVYVDLHSGPD